MIRSVSKSRFWVQIAAVLFLLNSASAFGACCVVFTSDASVDSAPCHQQADVNSHSQSEETAQTQMEEDCCVACAPAAPVHAAVLQASVTQFSQLPTVSFAEPLGAPEAPYRPPIGPA